MKFQGQQTPSSKVNVNNDMMNGPLGQLMAMQLMVPKMQQMQTATVQNPTVQNQLQAANIPQDQTQNFKTVPTLKEVGGAPVAVPEVKEKTDLPQQIGEKMSSMRTHASLMNDAAMKVISNPILQKQMGPLHPSSYSGELGETAMSARGLGEQYGLIKGDTSTDFSSIKAQVADTVLNYRRDMEGLRLVTGGLPLITPVIPTLKDVPHQFIGKTIGAITAMRQNDLMLQNYAKGQNFKIANLDTPFPGDPDMIRKAAHSVGMKVPLEGYKTSPIPGMNNGSQVSSNASSNVDYKEKLRQRYLQK